MAARIPRLSSSSINIISVPLSLSLSGLPLVLRLEGRRSGREVEIQPVSRFLLPFELLLPSLDKVSSGLTGRRRRGEVVVFEWGGEGGGAGSVT
jgi:hypothetical protein